MSKLNITGLVTYLNGAPVRNGRVRIYDKDGDGDPRDLILDERTNQHGHFAGKSREWEDTLLDVLDLEFRVDADARTHTGPFFHFSGASVPIVFPGPPVVVREERHLLHVITLSAGTENKQLYEVIEFGARAVAAPFGSASYKSYSTLEGSHATPDRLLERLSALSENSGCEAVDLLFCTHGSSEKVHFFGDALSAGQLTSKLTELPAAVRAKFRAVFSTACFGQTHLNAWIDGGFRVASGSRGIYADSALSFPVFLGAWSAGVGFAQAVQAANAADPAHIQDGLAKNWYEGRGLSSFASQVNSVRVVRGNGGLNINSPR